MFIADKIIYRDDDKFIKLYIGDDLVWEKTNVEDNKYVTFTAEENNSSIGLARLSSNQTLEYSIDTINWNQFNTDVTISLPNVGDEVYIRGILNADIVSDDYTKFKMSGKIAASGNCNALWNYEDVEAPLKDFCGANLFKECYGLTTTPELPATELSDGCYSNMFSGCIGLVKAPELPATELSDGCYSNMFGKCSSLTKAPILPAKILTPHCYEYMFIFCNSLNEITCLATDISATDCLTSWVYGGASYEGTFYKAPGVEWPKNSSGIPPEWTVVDYEET